MTRADSCASVDNTAEGTSCVVHCLFGVGKK